MILVSEILSHYLVAVSINFAGVECGLHNHFSFNGIYSFFIILLNLIV